MLTYEARVYTMQVGRGRKSAFLMLAMMVLWIAMPASACLRATQPTWQHACCHGMMTACGSSAINANGSCCLVYPRNIAVTLVLPYSSDHSRKLPQVSHPASLHVPATTNVRHENASTSPPPLFSSVGNSTLRI